MSNRRLRTAMMVCVCLCALIALCGFAGKAKASPEPVEVGEYTIRVKAGTIMACEFVPTRDGWYLFEIDNEEKLHGNLEDDAYKQLASTLSYSEDGFRIKCYLTANETYFVNFAFDNNSIEGEVTLRISEDVPEQIFVGTSSTVHVYAGETTMVKFIPTETATYVFETVGSADTYGYLYDASLNRLAVNDNGGVDDNFRLKYDLTAGETYYVGVYFFYDGKPAGDVTLQTSAYVRPDGQQVYVGTNTIELIENEIVKIKFVPEETGWYSFETVGIDETIGYLYDTVSENPIAANYSGSGQNFRLRHHLTADETYYIGVNAILSHDIYTTMLVSTYDPADRAQVYEGANTVHADMGDVFVKFIPEESGEYVFETEGGEDTCGYLYSAEERELEHSNIGGEGNFRFKYDLAAGETYYVEVKLKSGLGNDVTLRISPYVPPEPDQVFEGTTVIHVGSRKATRVKFVPTKTGDYAFETISEEDTRGDLFNEWGGWVAGDSNSGNGSNFKIEYRLDAGATYYLDVIADYEYNYSGDIELNITAASVVETDEVAWHFDDGVLIVFGTGEMEDYSTSAPPWYQYQDEITQVCIEEGVTSIGEYAFAWCSSLESITIPESVESIGDYAFYGSEKLTVYCPEGSYAEQYAKDNDIPYANGEAPVEEPPVEEPSALLLPADLREIGEEAFAGSLFQVAVLLDGAVSIGSRAFANSALEMIAIPASVTNIAEDAFDGCGGLVIFCPEGSTAETFAIEHGFGWEQIEY